MFVFVNYINIQLFNTTSVKSIQNTYADWTLTTQIWKIKLQVGRHESNSSYGQVGLWGFDQQSVWGL